MTPSAWSRTPRLAYPQTVEVSGSYNWLEDYFADHGVLWTEVASPGRASTVLDFLGHIDPNLTVRQVWQVLKAAGIQ